MKTYKDILETSDNSKTLEEAKTKTKASIFVDGDNWDKMTIQHSGGFESAFEIKMKVPLYDFDDDDDRRKSKIKKGFVKDANDQLNKLLANFESSLEKIMSDTVKKIEKVK